jgi:hypothetical protein
MRSLTRRFTGAAAMLAMLLFPYLLPPAAPPSPALSASRVPLSVVSYCPYGCIAPDEPTCGEHEPICQVFVRLTQPAVEPVSLRLSTMDGTAHAGEDYVPLHLLPVVIQPGALDAPVPVTILPPAVAGAQFFLQILPDNPNIQPVMEVVTII